MAALFLIDGGLGAKSLSLGNFLIFLRKNNYFNDVWITFCTFLCYLKELN